MADASPTAPTFPTDPPPLAAPGRVYAPFVRAIAHEPAPGGDVFLVFRRQGIAAHVGGVLDDVIDQAEKTIDEIVPGAWFVMQTTLDQFPIPGYQSHGDPPFEAVDVYQSILRRRLPR